MSPAPGMLWNRWGIWRGAVCRLACENDLEGTAAKRNSDPYLVEHSQWLKIRNQEYSQWIGREELFECQHGSDPDFTIWDGCALACESADM